MWCFRGTLIVNNVEKLDVSFFPKTMYGAFTYIWLICVFHSWIFWEHKKIGVTWSLGWSMCQGSPIPPSGKIWSKWTFWKSRSQLEYVSRSQDKQVIPPALFHLATVLKGNEQWKRHWMFKVYRGWYCPFISGLLWTVIKNRPGFNGKYPSLFFFVAQMICFHVALGVLGVRLVETSFTTFEETVCSGEVMNLSLSKRNRHF